VAQFIAFIVIIATNNTLAKLLTCLKPELRNIFQGTHQPFMNIASSRYIRWIPAKQKFSPRKATHLHNLVIRYYASLSDFSLHRSGISWFHVLKRIQFCDLLFFVGHCSKSIYGCYRKENFSFDFSHKNNKQKVHRQKTNSHTVVPSQDKKPE